MYIVDKWVFDNSNEYEYKYKGLYGARGEKRKKRRKPTKEEMEKVNQRNKATRIRRLIKANFSEKDLWCCVKYPAGVKMKPPDVKTDIQRFLRALRGEYRKRAAELKFIYRMEVGSKGGVHFHIIVNRIWSDQTDVILQECWSRALKHSAASEQIGRAHV